MSERVMKVLANCGQGLDEGQKLQARTNIGAIGGVKVFDGSTTEQLTPDADGNVTVDLSEAGKVQSDWDESNSNEPSYIRNKPDLSQYALKSDLDDVTGVFIGVYTGTEETTTPFADFKDAWDAGKALFLRRTIDNAEHLFAMESITSDTIEFTRTTGSVSSNTYGDVKSYMARVHVADETDTWNFYEKQLGDNQVQSDWAETDNTKKSFIRNKPNLATVATSGSYNDLSNKPTIPAAQVQSDWAQADSAAVDYIKNKPAALETKPLVAGTNIEFNSTAQQVTINSTATKVVKRPAPYSADTPISEMIVYDPGEDYGAVVRDQNDNNIGYLAPKHYGDADLGKVLSIVNDNGYKMEWRNPTGGSMDLKPLTIAEQHVVSENPVTLTVADGYAYEVIIDTNGSPVVNIATNSEETVHSIISVRNGSASQCATLTLVWRDEAMVQHSIELYMYEAGTNILYNFDVYVKKVVVNNTAYAIARLLDFPVLYRKAPYAFDSEYEGVGYVGLEMD